MRYILFMICALAAASANAEIHKWVDSEGKVHYTDEPPPAKAQSRPLTIKPAPAPTPEAAPATPSNGATPPKGGIPTPAPDAAPATTPNSGAAGPKTMSDKEQEFRKRRAQEEEAKAKREKEQQEAKQREQNCAQARSSLRTLQEGGRVYSYDAKGERVFMDEAARQQAIANAQKSVDSWCK